MTSSYCFTHKRTQVLVPTFHSTPTYPNSDSKGRSFGTPTIKQTAVEILHLCSGSTLVNRAGTYSVSATEHVASVPNCSTGMGCSWGRSFTLGTEKRERRRLNLIQ